MKSTTSASSSKWIDRHFLKLNRYLRKFHNRTDWSYVVDVFYNQFPDEAKKLQLNSKERLPCLMTI